MAFLMSSLLCAEAFAEQLGGSSQPGAGAEGKTLAPPSVDRSEMKKATTMRTPTYNPPKRGAPGGRVGGGTRGGPQTFTLAVLAPNHTGLTAQDQPILYWYLSKSISTSMEFTLIDFEATRPLVEKVMNPPFKAGIQRLRLADFDVHLEPGKQYLWSVTLVTNPKRRSKDVFAGATIERAPLPEPTALKLAKAGNSEAVHLYAEVGHWYDAVAMLSELIDSNPNDAAFRKQRAALLQQVGLTEIAEQEFSLNPLN